MNARILMRTLRPAMQPEPVIAPDHRWPVVAHPWLGGAFPLCGMALRPSPDRTMLERVLGMRESVR